MGEGGYAGTGTFSAGGEGAFSFGRAVGGKKPGPITKPIATKSPAPPAATRSLALRGPIADEPGNRQLRMFNISHQGNVAASTGNSSTNSTATNVALAILISLGVGGAAIGASRWGRR